MDLESLLLRAYKLVAGDVIVAKVSELGDFELPLGQEIILGTPLKNMKELVSRPDVFFKIERMICNSPCPGFVYITDIKASNMSAAIASDDKPMDSYNFSPAAKVPASLGFHHVIPSSSRVMVFASYSGLVPDGCKIGDATYFTATFYGKAYCFND